MEARATLKGTSVSKTFIAAVLVLVAMGLGAMGGYLANGQGASVSPATGRAHIQGLIDRPELPAPAAHAQGVIDRPELTTPAAQGNQLRGTRGDHGELE